MTTYQEPHTEVEQDFTNESTSSSDQTLNACIIGPAYTMVEAEAGVEYVGAQVVHTFAPGTGLVPDTRVNNEDEIHYPVGFTITDAHCTVRAMDDVNFGVSVKNSKVMTCTDGFVNVSRVTGAKSYVEFDAVTAADHPISSHELTAISISALNPSNQRVVTLNGAYAQLLDLPAAAVPGVSDTFYRGLYFAAAPHVGYEYKAIVSISDDRTQITIQDTATGSEDWHTVAGPTDMLMVSIGYAAAPAAAAETALHPTEEVGPFLISTVTDDDTATINGLPNDVAYTNMHFSIYEEKDVVVADASAIGCTFAGTTSITIPAGVTDQTSYLRPVTGGTLEFKYRALNTNLANVLTRIDIATYTTDVVTKLGSNVAANTGCYAAYQACRNSNIDVYFVGVDETLFTDIGDAYGEAVLFLLDQDGVYHLAPCTLDFDAHTAIDVHVSACSVKDVAKWRVCYISTRLKTETAITEGETVVTEGINIKNFKDEQAGVNFTAEPVLAGDILKITAWEDIVPISSGLTLATTGDDGAALPVSYNATTKTLNIKHGATGDWAALTTSNTVGKNIGYSTSDHDTPMLPIVTIGAGGDGGTYIDNDHPIGSCGLKFLDLGYKIRGFERIDATHVEFVLDAIGMNPDLATTLTQAGTTGQDVVWTIYDSILSAAAEYEMAHTGMVVSTVSTYEVNLATGLKDWSVSNIPEWHKGKYLGCTYEIVRAMTKDQQAEYIAGYASSFANRRTRLVWPDMYYAADGTEIKGYNIAAQTGGAYAGMNPQESLTRHSIKSGYLLGHTNGYFSNLQLNIMAAGGVTIFKQTSAGVNAICRHQQSTDPSTIYYREPSITHSVDKASYMVWTALDKLPGFYSITEDLFTVGSAILESVKNRLLEKKPRIGGILKSFDITSFTQDTTDIDYCAVVLDCVPQVPCNGFKVLLRVN
jgi:hypothetical protein